MERFELCDGSSCDPEVVFNEQRDEYSIVRVRLANGISLPGALLRRSDYLHVLTQWRDSHAISNDRARADVGRPPGDDDDDPDGEGDEESDSSGFVFPADRLSFDTLLWAFASLSSSSARASP